MHAIDSRWRPALRAVSLELTLRLTSIRDSIFCNDLSRLSHNLIDTVGAVAPVSHERNYRTVNPEVFIGNKRNSDNVDAILSLKEL